MFPHTYNVFTRLVLLHCAFKLSSCAYPQSLAPTGKANLTATFLEEVLKLVGFSQLKLDVSIEVFLPTEFLVPHYTQILEYFSVSVSPSKSNLTFGRRYSDELPLIKILHPSDVNETNHILHDVSTQS